MSKPRRRRRPSQHYARQQRPQVRRDSTLPGPTQEQINQALRAIRDRPEPQWVDRRIHDDFYRWLSELDDPFAQAYFASLPVISEQGTVRRGDEALERRLAELAPEALVRFERAQAKDLGDLTVALRGVDPVPILCGMLLLTRMAPWGTYYEPESLPVGLEIELVGGVIASLPIDQRRPMTIQDLTTVASKAHAARLWAQATQAAKEYTAESNERTTIHNELVRRWITLRGASYPSHAQSFAKALAQDYRSLLRSRVGFDVDDVIDINKAIWRQWEQNISRSLSEAWSTALDVTNEDPTSLHDASNPFKEKWLTEAVQLLSERLVVAIDENAHLLGQRQQTRERAIFATLGVKAGEGPSIRSVLAEPIQRARPFLILPGVLDETSAGSDNEVGLLTDLAPLSTDFHLTVDTLMTSVSHRWPQGRARAIDRYATDLIQRTLPGSEYFTNLYFDRGHGQEEIDGVVVFQDIAIVIEGKGAPLKLAARRGSVDKLVSQLRELVSVGNRQLERDRTYVMGGRPARFYDENGNCVLSVDGSTIRKCYAVMPSLDGLADIGTNLSRLYELEILPRSATPWIVGVTDLNVVVDILDKPADFIGYLDFRERWASEPRLIVLDELEMLALYLYQVDLVARLASMPDEPGAVIMHAVNQAIFDRWYDGRSGEGPIVEKPRIETTIRIRRFVDELQRTRPDGWLASASAARQIPITVATVIEEQERELADHAAEVGLVSTGNEDCTIVVASTGLPWGEALQRMPTEFLSQVRLLILLRQSGRRLHLDEVRLNTAMDGLP